MQDAVTHSPHSLVTKTIILTMPPALPPIGRLPTSHLRALISLHHSSLHFITPATLPAIVDSVFSTQSVSTSDDRSLRLAAASRLDRQSAEGTLVPLEEVNNSLRPSSSSSSSGYDDPLLSHYSPTNPSAYPTAGYIYHTAQKQKRKERWSSSSRGGYLSTASKYGLGSFGGSNGGSTLRREREIRLRDAVYGTHGGGGGEDGAGGVGLEGVMESEMGLGLRLEKNGETGNKGKR